MPADLKIAVILVAAGNSSRLSGDVPKVYREWNGKPIIEHALEVFTAHPRISQVVVVTNPEHETFYAPLKNNGVWIISGGKTRQESVYKGLDALADTPPDWVLVHDAARPQLGAEVIDRVLKALETAPAAVPCLPVNDTIKREESGMAAETLPREALRRVQTPQGFHYAELLAAHIAAPHLNFTDDAAVAEAVGLPVALVEGCERNHKLTTPEDWVRLNAQPIACEYRTGSGFDVHAFIEDTARPLMICGIEIPSPLALAGHSDADVGLHALVDALLGAIGAGDIGEHFPPTDARWHNANSASFVREAMRLLHARGGRVINADITIIAEIPKIMPHKTAMRETIVRLLLTDTPRVNIKATTTEGLGFTGRKEGIAAHAVVSVALPAFNC